jgi:hypothetical protein
VQQQCAPGRQTRFPDARPALWLGACQGAESAWQDHKHHAWHVSHCAAASQRAARGKAGAGPGRLEGWAGGRSRGGRVTVARSRACLTGAGGSRRAAMHGRQHRCLFRHPRLLSALRIPLPGHALRLTPGEQRAIF